MVFYLKAEGDQYWWISTFGVNERELRGNGGGRQWTLTDRGEDGGEARGKERETLGEVK